MNDTHSDTHRMAQRTETRSRRGRTLWSGIAIAAVLTVGASTPMLPVPIAAAATPAAALPPPPPPPPGGPPTDDSAPVVKVPAHSVITSTFSTIPVKVSWSATDANLIERFEARLLTYPGPTARDLSLKRRLATSVTVRLRVGTRYRISVRATDIFGNRSAWKTGPIIKPTSVEDSSSQLTYHGRWTTVGSTNASGGTVQRTTDRGASASHRFNGRHIAVVAPIGPTYGSVKVYLDGAYIKTVSLRSATSRHKRIIFSRRVSSGWHTIKVVRASGTAALDAFVRIER